MPLSVRQRTVQCPSEQLNALLMGGASGALPWEWLAMNEPGETEPHGLPDNP